MMKYLPLTTSFKTDQTCFEFSEFRYQYGVIKSEPKVQVIPIARQAKKNSHFQQ
jgi:hypothetical protein